MGTKSKKSGTKTAKKPAAKKAAAPKTAAAKGETRNGVTQPKAGTKCRDIWSHLDAMKAAGKEYSFEDMRKTIDPSTADATLRTQRARWVKFTS